MGRGCTSPKTGRGREGNGREMQGRGGTDQSLLDKLIETLNAFSTGWEEIIKEDVQYAIVMEDECNGLENGNHMSDMDLKMTEKVSISLSWKVVSVTLFSVFYHMMSDIALLKIIKYTNQDLILIGNSVKFTQVQSVHRHKMVAFLSTYFC